jgi:hypothetical protein
MRGANVRHIGLASLRSWLPWTVLIALACAPRLCASGLEAGHAILRQVLSINAADLPSDYGGVLCGSFDISPDGSTLAIEFKSADARGMLGVQVAEWKTATGKQVLRSWVEGPVPPQQFSNPQYRYDLRFTPDGRRLVVLTGPRVGVFESSSLKPLYSVAPASIRPTPRYGLVITKFSISGDGSTLAVLSTGVTDLPGSAPVILRLYQLETGRTLAEWQVRDPGNIALSPDGKQILFSDLAHAWTGGGDVLLVDSKTGDILRSFSTGWRHGIFVGASDAQFINTEHFIVTSNLWSNSSGHYDASALKIFDIKTGRPMHELTYPPYGARGTIVVAAHMPVLAAISGRQGPAEILSDDDRQTGGPQLLLFRLSDSEPFYVSHDLPPSKLMSASADRYLLRLSADGTSLAIFEDNAVRVYEIETAT